MFLPDGGMSHSIKLYNTYINTKKTIAKLAFLEELQTHLGRLAQVVRVLA